MHVDDWLDEKNGTAYARFMLEYFRLPAIKKYKREKSMEGHRLFCDFEGKRMRVTGASRFGDIWLTSDFNQNTGYEKRVNILDCSGWGDIPYVSDK